MEKEGKCSESKKFKVKHGGGGVMVWGSMAWSRVGNFEFIDGIMMKKVYLEIL